MAKYTGLYGMDLTPEEETAGFLDVSKAAGTPLHGIPEFEKKFYASRDYGALPSMYELYLGGGFDASQPDFPIQAGDITGGGGDGGGGAGTGATTTGGTGGVNTPFEQNLLDQGIGVQAEPGAPISAPGEGMLTQQAIDDLADYPVTQPMTGGITEDPIEVGIPDSETNFVDPLGTISGAPVVGDFDEPTMGTVDVTKSFVDQPEPLSDVELAEQGFLPAIPDVQVEGGLSPIDEERLANYKPSTEPATTLGGKINSAFENVKAKGTAGIGELRDKLVGLGGKVKEGFDNVIDFGGTAIDIGKTLKTGVINYIGKSIFGPVGALLGTALQALPEDTLENKTTRGIVDELKAENDYGFNMQSGNLNQDPFGRNPVSALGDYEQTLMDDIAGTGKWANWQTAEMTEKKKQFAIDYFNKKAEFAGGAEVDDGTVLGPGEAPGEDLVTLEDQLQQQQDEAIYAGIEAAEEDKDLEDERIEVENRAAQAEVQRIENERAANVREEARANAAREAEAEARAAARERARQPAPTYTAPSPHRPEGDGAANQGGNTSSGGGWGPWAAKGGLIRKPYGKGGIVSLKYAKK